MGYACPVCETPQSDARHLANHLAFTALIRGADHEAWLDDHVPGWDEEGEAELAARVETLAEETDFPQVFEDTVGTAGEHQHDGERSGRLFEDDGPGVDGHGHGHGHGHDHDHDHGTPARNAPPAPRDEETRAVLEEARDLTERMLAEDDSESETADDAGTEPDDNA
ncbi:DUF5810 domain-containing protein [Halomarina ordinaria]|uniref:DUF5810 domain-containing protein n=1 Tax=Halomarina ordinaria TaxID=3033939 RepID=A0ABD5UAY4_9EURY|nr:DUF5810 domain-containing protein [Halomarina sp. PSRA2]